MFKFTGFFAVEVEMFFISLSWRFSVDRLFDSFLVYVLLWFLEGFIVFISREERGWRRLGIG